jgi:16S rRNA (uracil1498-N3)-methyltransferase
MRRTRLLLADFPNDPELTHSQLHYLKHVLRLQDNNELEVFDGKGNAYIAQLQFIDKKTAQLRLITQLPQQATPSLSIHLGLGISKAQHMDIALQKSAELGVDTITPIISARCEGKHFHHKLTHWQEILINACQQSGHNYLPKLLAPCALPTWRDQLNHNIPKLICVPAQPMRLPNCGLQIGGIHNKIAPQQVIVLTGAEGGFTEDEITAALTAGFIATGLGPRILRTETAPLVAISLLQFIAGDLQP